MVHRSQDWPELGEERDGATIAALHLFSQVAGKVPTALLPWRNHGWHLTFHICPEGFRTEPIHAHAGTFELGFRSEEHTSELQSLMRNSYAVFCLKKKNTQANDKSDLMRH